MFFREDEDAIFEEDTNEWVTKKQAEHIRQLRASNERLRQQLEVARRALECHNELIRAATEVSRYGAQTGSQWVKLTSALLDSRAAASSYEALTEAGKCKDGG